MKKIYHILILLILSLSGYSQVYQSMPQYGYGPVKRFWVDSTLSIPTVCGVPTLKSYATKQAAIAFDSCNNRFYFYNPKTLAWDTIKGGGASIDTTSLSGRIELRLKISDTAAMLLPYLRKVDTASMSLRIASKVDSLNRSADSVYYYKNGQKYLAFRDSTGGGGQNGRWGNDTATIVLAKVRNATATTMAKGTVVMLSGATGDVASVIRANNKYDSTSARTIGLVKDAIAAGDTGWVVTQGQASKLNLGAYSEGDVLYLDSIDGGLTKTKPVAPYHGVFVCIVERANNGNGLAYVKPQNGAELSEIHDVKITSPVNNHILVYSDTQDIWKNRSAYSVIDTSKLSARIDQRVKYSDTATMLTNYARKNYFNLQNVTTNGNITDSSIKALDYYFYDKAAEDFGQQKIDFSDNSFRFTDADNNRILELFSNNISIGNDIRYGLISTDYITNNRRIDFPDTSGTFALRGDSTLFQTKYRSDTARTNTYAAISTKLSSSDSTIYQTKYRSDTARTNTYAAIKNLQPLLTGYDEANDRLGIKQMTPTSSLHINSNKNTATQSDTAGILLANSTAAINNTQSVSPPIVWQGNGWKTTATAASQDVRFRAYVLPVQGTTNPTGQWLVESSINSGAYTQLFSLTSGSGASIGPVNYSPGKINISSYNIKTAAPTENVMTLSSTETGSGGTYPTQLNFLQKGATVGWNIQSVNQGVGYTPIILNELGGNILIGTATNAGFKLDVNGTARIQNALTTAGNLVAYVSKTGAYTATATDEIIASDATSAAFTITLPTAASKTGQRYTIKKTDSSANAVTVGTTSSQTIDGSATYSLATQYKFITVVSNGSNWLIISSN
jgi:hypothetical protein